MHVLFRCIFYLDVGKNDGKGQLASHFHLLSGVVVWERAT